MLGDPELERGIETVPYRLLKGNPSRPYLTEISRS
jgi:hypothetical protein